MKKQLAILAISVLLLTGTSFTSIAQQKDKKNHKKEQQPNQDNKKEKQDKAGKFDGAKNKNNGGQANKMAQKESAAKHTAKANKHRDNGKHNTGKNDEKNQANKGRQNKNDDYNWNQETFRNRKQVKNQEKVTLCHKFRSSTQPGVTITVSSNAVRAHMKHGDAMGTCAVVKSNGFSDIFLQKRTDYYNGLQNSQENLLYSRSILDYALVRLTDSRLQLTALQNNRMPQVEIERKQATVVELEQNVSLLEALIGVTANFVVDKLQ
jgi:hypothetical protein